MTIGPDNGTAYVGALGGLIALRDATRPRLPRSPRLKVWRGAATGTSGAG